MPSHTTIGTYTTEQIADLGRGGVLRELFQKAIAKDLPFIDGRDWDIRLRLSQAQPAVDGKHTVTLKIHSTLANLRQAKVGDVVPETYLPPGVPNHVSEDAAGTKRLTYHNMKFLLVADGWERME